MKNSLLEDVHGNLSTKRVMGCLTILAGLVMAFLKGFHFYEIDSATVLGVLGSGSLMISSTALERKGPEAPPVNNEFNSGGGRG